MSEIEDIVDTEFDKLLQQLHLSKLEDLCINEWLDMPEELLDIISDPVDDTLSTSEMPWEVSKTAFHSWMLPLMGVVITLIDHAHQLFTYLNFSFIRTNV